MIDIVVNPRALTGVLDNLSERQLPFATMKALNETATIFQADERARMQQAFTIRRPWVLQGVKIDRGDFATKDKLSVRVHIDDGRDFLGKFEQGGTRTPTGRSLAVPIDVRSSKAQVIPTSKRPRAFNFHEVGGSRMAGHASHLNKSLRRGVLRGGLKVYEGDSRTILIQNANGSGVILQRVGRGKNAGLKTLYVLKPSTPIPASLHFYETAYRSFGINWTPTFTKWWNEAIRTMRMPGVTTAQGMALPAGWAGPR